MENTEEKSQGNEYLKNLCPVTKYKLSMKWVHVYNGKSDQSVLPITYNMMP